MTLAFIYIMLISLPVFQPSDRRSVYDALSEGNIQLLEENISRYEELNRGALENAYLGALYMRSASFLRTPAEKSSVFKKGKSLLEEAISSHPQHAEMRLLRLMIQENSPPFLRYNNNINEDKQIVLQNFRRFDEALKQIIRDYANVSEALKDETLP